MQEIKVKPKLHRVVGDWEECKKHAKRVEELSVEIEKSLTHLANNQKKLSAAITEAYKSAPLTDCGFGVSPISPTRVMHAMKAHLLKHGMRVDTYSFGDETKIPTFSESIKNALNWLLKFS